MEIRYISLDLRWKRFFLIRYLDTLHLHLCAGYEFNFAWSETLEILKGELSEKDFLLFKERKDGLFCHYTWRNFHSWFQVLNQIYESGASLGEAVKGISQSLKKEDHLDLESHLRTLPTKMQIILILFYFPSTILLLIVPIIMGI